ncbi:MAG: MBL fold metallo-hydrolase [Spirochaetales bacterium]|nr:MBL fold metallo-hydrolase [Spirochaetales bacterium]
MQIRFWGVRGSCPTPLKPAEVTGKISSILQRITPEDIASPRAKERFIAQLPLHLKSTTGGNTACVEVRLEDNTLIILDCGSGLRSLYDNLVSDGDQIRDYHIFLTHFHYDHLVGMPFFTPLYDKNNRVHFYSPYGKMEKIVREYFRKPYHPVPFDAFQAQIEFNVIGRESLWLGPAKIDWVKRNHPDGSVAYRIEEGKGVFIFSTDTELEEKNFKKTRKNISFFQDADVLVMDGQYDLTEAIDKMTWGHSSYSMAVEFAQEFDIKKLMIYHHEPMNDDRQIDKYLKVARTYTEMLNKKLGKKLILDFALEEGRIEL